MSVGEISGVDFVEASAWPLSCSRPDTMAVHAGAAMAKVALDRVGHCLGAVLLAAVWTAEFFLLLRPGEFFYRSGSVAGESAHLFLAGDWLVAISISLHHRLSRGLDHRQAHHWRHRIYVRSWHSVVGAAAEFVSRRDASAFIVGDLATGIQSPWMEASDADHLDRGSDQLFLAA